MTRKCIEIDDDALAEVRHLFKTKQEFMDMLNRMNQAINRGDRYLVQPVMCTKKQWKRYKDCLTRTRTFFSEDRNAITIHHILPRTDYTYILVEFLWKEIS